MEIVVSRNNTECTRYAFERGTITIGRDFGNEIRLESPAVLEKHARLSLFDDGCQIQSLAGDSTVFVNSNGVEKARLYDQDVVRIGPYQLVIHDSELVRKTGEAPEAEVEPTVEQRIEGAFTPFEHKKTGPGPASGRVDTPRSNLMFTGVDLLTGPVKGKRIRFTGNSAKLGIRNETVVAIRPSQHGYMVSATNHYLIAKLNGERLTDKPSQLSDGDLIEFSELKARFFVESGDSNTK